MRKIKRIAHLRQEQKRLRRQEAELEKDISRDWKSIRENLEPASLAREGIRSVTTWIGRKIFTKTKKSV